MTAPDGYTLATFGPTMTDREVALAWAGALDGARGERVAGRWSTEPESWHATLDALLAGRPTSAPARVAAAPARSDRLIVADYPLGSI